jgi:asparagine synthase (glutamine-hydrolysing)
MAFGVEIRVPMLDHIFYEFVAAYRPEDLLKGQSKQILRDSLRGVVPEAVLNQKLKFGFAAPLEQFLAHDRKATYNYYQDQIKQVPFLNQKLAQDLATQVLIKQDSTQFNYFWRTLSVSVWYNTFFNA